MRRRGIEIHTAFAPTRLSAMYLRAAYEAVSPVVERTVVGAAEQAVVEARDSAGAVLRRRGKEGASR
jgi:hypothetical protein